MIRYIAVDAGVGMPVLQVTSSAADSNTLYACITGDPVSTGLMRDQLVMLNLFPELPAESYSSSNEIIFIVDRSGEQSTLNSGT